jgi:hypothetical protein
MAITGYYILTNRKIKNKFKTIMKKTKIIYWILTGLFAFLMLGSAVPDIISANIALEGFKAMGYPAYLVPFLGIAKLLGVIAILVPEYARIKEWAYAGLLFDLIGAIYSVISIGISPAEWLPMLVIIVLGLFSYVYYHRNLRLSSINNIELA